MNRIQVWWSSCTIRYRFMQTDRYGTKGTSGTCTTTLVHFRITLNDQWERSSAIWSQNDQSGARDSHVLPISVRRARNILITMSALYIFGLAFYRYAWTNERSFSLKIFANTVATSHFGLQRPGSLLKFIIWGVDRRTLKVKLETSFLGCLYSTTSKTTSAAPSAAAAPSADVHFRVAQVARHITTGNRLLKI